MSIQELPPTTVRIIGSSQVLSDPASVVKELIDNSLDARANAVSVEISANTLDIVQVRDNGHGVSPEDRDVICKRYCTSKIRDYADLKEVGGRWLGFRGEALASAVELSGSLVMTTRVGGEDCAVSLVMSSMGHVERRSVASHPVGSTVRVTDLFKHLPVRKQTALKNAQKCLVKIKRIMQAYALARPSTRFSLRVLKAKNDKWNWTYAPKVNGSESIKDAVSKVIGKDCAAQCSYAEISHEGFLIQAFIPNEDAEASKIANKGHFFSVDSRPVSATRGLLNQMLKVFKEKLRSSNASLVDVKDPFIWLNIVCPRSSYDANVEPAKDDVVFQDGDAVLAAVRKLLDQRYQQAAPVGQPLNSGRISEPVAVFEDVEDDARAAKRRRLEALRIEPLHEEGTRSMLLTPEHQRRPYLQENEEEAEETSELRDVQVSNPWVMAKMTRSAKRPLEAQGPALNELSSSQINSNSTARPINIRPPKQLPTPDASSSPIRAGNVNGQFLTPATVTSRPERNACNPNTEATDIDQESNNPELRLLYARQRQHARPEQWKAANDFIPAGQLPMSSPPRRDLRSLQGETATTGYDESETEQQLSAIRGYFRSKPSRRPLAPSSAMEQTHHAPRNGQRPHMTTTPQERIALDIRPLLHPTPSAKYTHLNDDEHDIPALPSPTNIQSTISRTDTSIREITHLSTSLDLLVFTPESHPGPAPASAPPRRIQCIYDDVLPYHLPTPIFTDSDHLRETSAEVSSKLFEPPPSAIETQDWCREVQGLLDASGLRVVGAVDVEGAIEAGVRAEVEGGMYRRRVERLMM
ncbi:MAG: hypothetical protein M1828_005352 [Chrysothrix sp. TS-e1954]|nr:MAG: hypothetical protein M1828_005352 [Chrysothrix sp. TS-e1954]